MKNVKKWVLSIVALVGLTGGALAQNITGTWQGTLKAGPQDLRIVIKISTTDADRLSAVFYSIDQPSPAFPANTFTRNGSTVKMTLTQLNGTYEGKVSADGNLIEGTWTQGGPLPLNLTRATNETAWTIPEPPPPPKQMDADAKPGFEVSTIKPALPGRGFSLLVNRSGMLNTTSTTVSDLIKFAYDLHPRQITKGPSWLESERFDITAKPDTGGMPNPVQLKAMIQKLLADRFQLTFHREKKELSVYAITVSKTGAKITKSESPLNLPGFFGGGPRGMNVTNATMAEFGNVLQSNVLELPVVDQSGLGTTRYTFILKWTPDASLSQIGGAAPPPAAAAANADAPPDIFTAFQQQLGLKLENTKAQVDVVVIDRLEKPSEN